jgi:hypothetical protein
MKTARVVLLALLLPWLELRLRAAEPILPLRTNDVIAFIGGANMVALAQSGHLETLLTIRHPHHKLRFRSLAWEGDTVFAQPRDVNYPDLVTQLKQIGATVAFVQFGQMESLAGEAGLTNFVRAYEALLDRISPACPRFILLRPPSSRSMEDYRYVKGFTAEERAWIQYAEAIRRIAQRQGISTRMLYEDIFQSAKSHNLPTDTNLEPTGASAMYAETDRLRLFSAVFGKDSKDPMINAIAEKNRLWFDYARPSNWAFLAGDRTEQAFSRDYRDRNIRAFAQEMQQFLPLIADAEKRIDELAAKAAAEKETTR